MANLIKSKRGLDIAISGTAQKSVNPLVISDVVAVIPDHYHAITPKVMVKEGDIVKAGTPLFYNKAEERMKFVSPVSGKVLAINRGERRKVLSITIQADKETAYESFNIAKLETQSAEDIKNTLLQSGIWTYIKQRPYDVIANPTNTPKAIFISGFDSAPLAADYEFVLANQITDFQTGINALAKLTAGKIHLGIKAGSNFYNSIQNVEITTYQGPHPLGNVGVQINKVSPVNKGEVVWTVNALDILFIGRLFNKGVYDVTRTLAITGPEVLNPAYIQTVAGCQMDSILANNVSKGNNRFISGNVLTGLQVTPQGHLDPYATQVTVVKEGDDVHEMFGWAMPRFNRFSVSGTYFSSVLQKVFGKKSFDFDTRMMGGERAIIMSGEYDKVLPMDILPEYLIKAMIAGNIDKMENLGAYEIAPEDVALCEFVCTSKLPIQQIVRDSLDFMRKELE